jgi:3-hydroxybutyryl-CoA dehydrogenase
VLQIYLLSTTYFCKKGIMKIGVFANDEQWNELAEGITHAGIVRITSLQDMADAYIILDNTGTATSLNLHKPVLLNAVNTTLTETGAGSNVVRINGWAGFLQRKTWEVAGEIGEEMKMVFDMLQKQYITVKDEPGLVAARTISMIVNEAYFALGEGVSTKEAIDIAMKLGTNYPSGPFEWCDKIGIKNIYGLLYQLSKTDKRYLPAPLLEKEATA